MAEGKQFDNAIERFTELMAEKIENLQVDWKKPWISPCATRSPRNLSGRFYNGGNSLMLMMQAEKMGYEIPVWGTFDRIVALNTKTNDGNLPSVCVNRGERSFPVYFPSFTVINSETREKISYDDYRNLSKEEQMQFHIYPKMQVYNVFNVVAQTNLRESRPQMYNQLLSETAGEKRSDDLRSHPAIDMMIDEDLYFCPIRQVRGDDAYYSIQKDEIVIPHRSQFTDGESFASNTLHECAHATGSASRLGRLKPAAFGSSEYAREELTAELSAAVVASRFGLTKHIKSDSAAYLKSWLDSLHESPEFLKTILSDVKRASAMLSQRIEAVDLEISKGETADFSRFKPSSDTSQSRPDVVDDNQVAKLSPSVETHHLRMR